MFLSASSLGDRANRQIIQKRLVLVGFADRRDTDVFDEILFLTFNLFVIDRQNRCEILDVYAGESDHSFVIAMGPVAALGVAHLPPVRDNSTGIALLVHHSDHGLTISRRVPLTLDRQAVGSG